MVKTSKTVSRPEEASVQARPIQRSRDEEVESSRWSHKGTSNCGVTKNNVCVEVCPTMHRPTFVVNSLIWNGLRDRPLCPDQRPKQLDDAIRSIVLALEESDNAIGI